jgi:glycosyltransferase involved in cell wall biosynthesis
MKICVVNVQAVFVRGGAEYLGESLVQKLQEYGHEAELVRIPTQGFPAEQVIKHMLAFRILDLMAGEPDLVIALKFPAYLMPFPNKKVWLLHQFRGIYELWETPWRAYPDTPESHRVRSLIMAADNRYLPQAKKIFTNSKIVAGRLKRYNGIQADEVLYPPLRRPEIFHPGEPGDYFFYPSRLNNMKRQALAVEAMVHVKSNFRLVLAGRADYGTYQEEFNQLIEKFGVGDKVQLLGWISEEEKARWMAGACGALYLPFQEDSYGYVTLEAFHSAKPVITLTDSGGTDELVEHEHNGLILEPTAEALAAGMERLWSARQRTREMGQAAYETLARRKIDWNYVIERLVA